MSPPSDTGNSFAAIADFVLRRDLQVPDDALAHCATLLIDTLAVAAGATKLEVGRIARDHAVAFHAAGDSADAATLLFDGRRASLPGVTWAMATQIDNLDGHDGYMPSKGHIGCAVVPALAAFAERHPKLSGPEALTAMIVAYEVAARAAIALHATVSEYHTSGAWNALGVVALGARLDRLSEEQLRHALGIAEYHGPRSQMMREIANPTMLHDGSGMGALAGSMATLLAARGFTGAPAITVEDAEVAPYWADLGTNWTVTENYIKPYPCCRWAHPAIDALRALKKAHGFEADDVKHIEVRSFDEAAQLFSAPPDTTSQAQYSMNFVMAVMLRYGEIAPSHLEGDALRDPAVLALLPRIAAVSDPRHSARFPAERRADIEVVLKDGRRFTSGDTVARGGPGAWMSDAEVEEKVHSFCSGVLSKTRSAALWSMRDRMLQPESRFAELAALLHEPGDTL